MEKGPLAVEDADIILEPIVKFPEINVAFERLQAITDFRKDDDEARILYTCRQVQPENEATNGVHKDDLYILKCKVQARSVLEGGQTEPVPGPSKYTAAELAALKVFTNAKSSSLPHLVAWKRGVQGSDGILPGGYIIYTVMTRMPGENLKDLGFWSLPEELKEEIRDAFIPVLKDVWRFGFDPYDRALRNILWDVETKKLSLVDFEHWHPMTKDPINMHQTEEMQRWGIVQRQVFTEQWKEFMYTASLMRPRQ